MIRKLFKALWGTLNDPHLLSSRPHHGNDDDIWIDPTVKDPAFKYQTRKWRGTDDDRDCLNCGEYVMPMDICPCSCNCSRCRAIMISKDLAEATNDPWQECEECHGNLYVCDCLSIEMKEAEAKSDYQYARHLKAHQKMMDTEFEELKEK